jgi:hypothetical protein
MARSEIGNGIGVDPRVDIAFSIILGLHGLFGKELILGIATAIAELILIFGC